jgi:hypothetical protein
MAEEICTTCDPCHSAAAGGGDADIPTALLSMISWALALAAMTWSGVDGDWKKERMKLMVGDFGKGDLEGERRCCEVENEVESEDGDDEATI